jgi:uncharacterized membrane protein
MVKRSWENVVKDATFQARARELRRKNALKKFVSALKKLLTVELLIGLIAAFSLYVYFGAEELFRTLLSWVIGITLATTVITFMVDRYKKVLQVAR